ncbi:MAG TPA: hypothetical protein VF199_06795 [Bacillales bacterium]
MACHDKLDDMLDEQRQGYQDLPRLSSVDKIMSRIEAEADKPRKKNRRKRDFLPWAAGIAAAFLLAALALSQLQADPGQQIAFDTQAEVPKKGQTPGNNLESGSNESGYSDEKRTASPFVPDKVPSTIDQTKTVLKKMKETGASASRIDGVFTEFLQARMNAKTERTVKLTQLGQTWLQNHYNFRELMPGFEQPEKIKDAQLRSYAEKLKNEGYRVITREGNLELKYAYNKFQKAFSPYVSNTMDAFLEIQADSVVYSEGTFEGTWDHLGETLVKIDQFLKKHPEFPFAKDLKTDYQLFLPWYLTGNYSKDIVEEGSDIVKNEVRQSFQALIQDNPATFTAKVVEEYYNQIKQNGFKKVPRDSFEMPDFPSYLKMDAP